MDDWPDELSEYEEYAYSDPWAVVSGEDVEQNVRLKGEVERQKMRRDYAIGWASFAKKQILVTLGLVFMQGIEALPWKLEPEVMIALLGSASLNSLAVVIIITKGLFGPAEK